MCFTGLWLYVQVSKAMILITNRCRPLPLCTRWLFVSKSHSNHNFLSVCFEALQLNVEMEVSDYVQTLHAAQIKESGEIWRMQSSSNTPPLCIVVLYVFLVSHINFFFVKTCQYIFFHSLCFLFFWSNGMFSTNINKLQTSTPSFLLSLVLQSLSPSVINRMVYPVKMFSHFYSALLLCTQHTEKKKQDVQWQCFMNLVCYKYDCAFGGGRMKFRCF